MVKDDVGIQLKYLSTEEMKVHDGETDSIEKMFKIIVDSIDYVFDAENIYKGKETSKAEMSTFVEAMTEDVFDNIKEFFGNQPRLKHEVDYRCSKCGHKEPVLLEGLEDFFGFA
jgi:rubrerythrin